VKLVIGLGNPGSEYLNNRHNMGFMALDSLSAYYHFGDWKTKFDGMFTTKLISSKKIILVKPQTYMNLSGFCVAKFRQFFKVSDDDIFVIYDDIDLGFGDLKLKKGGGDAGHKGVRSISQHLGTKDFNRIRMGIGRPREKEEVSSFVLSNFSKTERDRIQILINRLCQNFEKIIQKKANLANQRNV
jgi:PTH1 family peptidyl-tRNA hydrolase